MDKETLDKINLLTRREFREEELYAFPVRLCDNDIDRDGECFSDEALTALSKLYIGKPGILDHDPRAGNLTARTFDAEVISEPGKTTKDGRPYKYLRGRAYMVRTDANRALIEEIEGGIKKEVSVSCSTAEKACSVCGTNVAETACGHRKGEKYGGKVCCHVIGGITDAYEWSFVAVPAQENAGVTKKYIFRKEEGSMEFTPINTQEEFDAAVQARVEAAVSEAKKGFEGWTSPEDFAALTKERDDLAASCRSLRVSAMKIKAANEKGVPVELAEKLSGETEDEISRDAESFARYFAKPKYRATPGFSADGGTADARSAAELELLREINNN